MALRKTTTGSIIVPGCPSLPVCSSVLNRDNILLFCRQNTRATRSVLTFLITRLQGKCVVYRMLSFVSRVEMPRVVTLQ